MASYKLKKDFKKSFINNANQNSELYWKIGSVINGKPNGSIVTTDSNGEVPKEGLVGVSYFDIPVDYLETISETKTKLILGNDSVNLNTPKNDKTFFTTKNIVIGVVGIVAIFGILKWKKII
jgi:hypothetical protein